MEHFNWKYDLCENEIHCEGRSIGHSDAAIFDIKDKAEFSAALNKLALRLAWLVERANATVGVNPKAIPALFDWARANLESIECRSDSDCDHCHLRQIIAVADGEIPDFPDEEHSPSTQF